MAHSSPPSETSVTGNLSGASQSPLSAYSIFGPTQYSESLALWNNPPVQPQPPSQTPAAPYTSAPPKTSSLFQPAPDHKKHKRTRSGCFTCRSRRIKCDETRPVCDRCRKGNRDCVYPPPSTTGPLSKPAPRSVAKVKTSRPQARGGESLAHVEGDGVRTLEPIADEGEEIEGSPSSSTTYHSQSAVSAVTTAPKPTLSKKQSAQSLRRRKDKQRTGATIDPVPGRKENSSSPSTESSSRVESLSARSASVGFHPFEFVGDPSTAHLPEDLRFYLSYHQDSLSFRHFGLRHSSARFLSQTVVELALQYEPLLYAVVGYSAYHHCVQTGGEKLSSFLKYYNKALSLLRQSLGSGEPYNEATLITVLMLATFEESIGDWVNLIDHHQAAHVLIRELLTPESASSGEMHRHIFVWYARFDLTAGILARNEMVLGRDWYIAREEYDAKDAADHPDDVEKQLEWFSSRNFRFALDMASLYAKLSRGMVRLEDFIAQNDQLGQMLERSKEILDRFTNSEYTVQSYPNQEPLTENDFVDPYVPGGFHYGPQWEVNFAWIDLYATKAMFKYQSLLSLKQESLWAELEALTLEQCRLIESVIRWPEKETGYVYRLKNSIPLASMFLPKDNVHITWSKQKLALLERNGHLIPPKIRSSLAALWQLPEINHWWLPDDEGYPAIIRDLREMAQERSNNPRDDFRESVRDMRALFWNLSLDDTESENSPSSSADTDIPRTAGVNQ